MNVETALLDAAARGDEERFLTLARNVGGIEAAQQLVRSSKAPLIRVGPAPTLIEKHRTSSLPLASRTTGRRTPRSTRTSVAPPRVVQLDRQAFEAMRSEIDHDGCEHGGFLLGTRSAGAIQIIDATSAGPNASRSRTHVRLSWDYAETITENWHARGHDVVIVGSWHVHPDGAAARPSERDIQSLDDALDRVGGDSWVEIVAAFPDSVSPSCQWRAWSMYRSDNGIVCTSVRLAIEGDD